LAHHRPNAAPIASVSGKVITLNSTSATHPFAPTYNGTNNSYSGITQVVIQSTSGALTTIPVSPNVGGNQSFVYDLTPYGPNSNEFRIRAVTKLHAA
jgi:hypothetical protein